VRAIPVLLALALLVSGCRGGDHRRDVTPAPTATGTTVEVAAPRLRDSEGLTTVEIAQKLKPSIVRITTESARLDLFGQPVPAEGVGTGVIIDTDGHIVTNNHVITSQDGRRIADTISVTLADQRTFKAVVVGRDQATDLAVLHVDADGLTPARFAEGDVAVGQDVVAIGFALGLEGEPTVTRGVISAKGRTIDEPPFTIPDVIQTDAGINPGNSGGALVNANGDIVGINTAIARGAQNVGFAISAALARPTVEQLIANGRIERAYLGIGSVDVTESIAESFGLPSATGIAITLVAEDSPAARAGLEQNDVIVRVDGQEVPNNGVLLAILARHRPGDVVPVEFYRGNGLRKVDVELGERPDS
jgi:serine protease Do